MAIIPIFDPVTKSTKTINGTVEAAVIEQDETGLLEFFILMATSTKQTSGADVPRQIIRELTTLADASLHHTQPPSSAPYVDLTEAIEDFVLHMVEGDGPGQDMDFS